MYIISGCLLGHNCKYNGGNNRNEDVIRFCEEHEYLVVCPESAGNLPTPRPPAEKVGNRILNSEGEDVTEKFLKGAEISFKICMQMAAMKMSRSKGRFLRQTAVLRIRQNIRRNIQRHAGGRKRCFRLHAARTGN